MKQSRKARDNSDSSDEDRHDHKHNKRTGRHRDKFPVGEMGSKHRSSANERDAHKHTKQKRHSHDKHTTDDMARHSSRRSRSRSSPPRVNDSSDSSDEIFFKGRASRRSRRDEDKNRARQQKSIDKTQKGSLRPSSSSSFSKEADARYGPVAPKSDSPPFTSSRQSQSRPSIPSKSAGISVNVITSGMKGITRSFLGRRSDDSHESCRPSRSRSRSKHEKRDKHGKKRESTSKFLAPLAQRWVCYQCGKLRSAAIGQRHPLKDGERMQPNWCGKCRVHGELSGRPMVFRGQRHYCWGCGIVRSQYYHAHNRIGRDEQSIPNYCQPCREASPAFDYNLREASEIGSVASIREMAFSHQVHAAELSDLVEEEEEHSPCAPGKENRIPEPEKQLKVSMHFMMENCSDKVRSISDEYTDGSVTTCGPEALHLDQERARSTSGGDCRLSDDSYQPPTVESLVSETDQPEIKSKDVIQETLTAVDGIEDRETKTSNQSSGDTGSSDPTVTLAHKQQRNSNGCIKKKVHWAEQDAPSMTAGSDASDSDYCSNYPSDLSFKSAGSRRDPGDISTANRPIHEGQSTKGNLNSSLSKKASSLRPESDGKGFDGDVHVQESFGISMHEADADTKSSRRGFSQSSSSIPPTTHDYFAPAFTSDKDRKSKKKSSPIPWFNCPETPSFGLSSSEQSSEGSPNFSRSFLSPPQQRAKSYYDVDPVFDSGFGARPGYVQDPGQFHSAAHFSDSTQRRDYSGFKAPGETYAPYQSERYGPTMQHGGGWPPVGYPTYDDYHAYAERHQGGYFGSYGDSDSPPPSNNNTPFDFSGFGSSNANGGSGMAPEGEKFVRSKKPTKATTSWNLCDDGDDKGGVTNTTSCTWRKDGRTTVHRSGDGKLPNEGTTVRVLSVREIGSDEDSTNNEDSDDISDLDTVVGDESVIKSICAN